MGTPSDRWSWTWSLATVLSLIALILSVVVTILHHNDGTWLTVAAILYLGAIIGLP